LQSHAPGLELAPEQPVGDLGQHPGPVAGPPVGAHGAAVREVREGGEAVGEHVVRRPPAGVGYEADAAGVALTRPAQLPEVGPHRHVPSLTHWEASAPAGRCSSVWQADPDGATSTHAWASARRTIVAARWVRSRGTRPNVGGKRKSERRAVSSAAP